VVGAGKAVMTAVTAASPWVTAIEGSSNHHKHRNGPQMHLEDVDGGIA
jgi:hypothetical protein